MDSIEQRARELLVAAYGCDIAELTTDEVRAARAILAWQSALSQAQPAAAQPAGGEVVRQVRLLPAPGVDSSTWTDVDAEGYEAALSIGMEGRAVYTAPPAAGAVPETWRPMETAPRDGMMVRLLVQFTDHATEDSEGPAWTIGANSFDDTGEDRWQFAGWCWNHDHFTEGQGTPVGWLPMLDDAQPAAQHDGCGACGDACARRPGGCRVAEENPPAAQQEVGRG